MFSSELITKKEAAEIALRPQPMPEDILSALVNELVSMDDFRFLTEFRKSTGLQLMAFGSGLYCIKY